MPLHKPKSQRSRLFRPPKRSASGTPKNATERSLSPLESLPVELLQKVFLFAENVALARSSPYIAAAVSSEHIIQQFTMRVLFSQEEAVPADQQASGTDTDAVADSPATVHASRQSERRSAGFIRNTGRLWRRYTDSFFKESTDILACRFMTWERFKICMQLGLPTFNASYFDHPYQLPFMCQGLKQLEKEQIPRKLLCGPWTPDKSAFLYFLTFVGLRAPRSCESIANEGLREAVSQQSPLAVAALVSPCVMARPTTKLLRSAVIDHDCHLAIVRLLLTPWEDGTGTPPFLDFQDAELLRWIETQKSRENHKGSWLGAALKEARFGILRHKYRRPGGRNGSLDVSPDEDAIIPIAQRRPDPA
ncbi:uncharacterized protein BDZ99DRAFT_10278 [Mytilinidion resinicola]|uniref:F-box domain-containing protein n=1 Tax=Mytilinidion resinicola TaxID=574789 RepID=A0A6A6Z7Z1_9PEZI|nr:uncharacterized protein BDZ99DRAFT_10278 [Mytilinidion resinicola]KAF2817156.1 hypothetical protein BDZ99DRAFT_10278 [Mytilinidion resinicola]